MNLREKEREIKLNITTVKKCIYLKIDNKIFRRFETSKKI